MNNLRLKPKVDSAHPTDEAGKMPTDPLQTSEKILAFDGTVSLATALGLGLLLSAIAAWLLWRDRTTVGTTWAALFWVLRTTAFGLALWMLVGPVRETIKRTTTPQSIAILSDISQSMETVDPADPVDLLRWTLASNTAGKTSPLTLCDSAKVALHLASSASQEAQQLLHQHRPLKEIKQALHNARTATQRTEKHCEALSSQLADVPEEDVPKEIADRVHRVETLLQGPIATAFDELQESLADDNTPDVGQLTDTLEILCEDLSSASRRIASLTQDLAEQLANESPTLESASNELSRREKSSKMLDALEKNVLVNLTENVRIQRFHFDSRLTPVSTQQSWSVALTTPPTHAEAEPPQLTNLTAVLQRLATNREAQSTRLAIVISDGNHNVFGTQSPQEAASQMSNLAIFTVPTGNSTLVRDLRLHRVEAPATVVASDAGLIEAIVTAVDCEGLSTEVILRHDGQEIDRQKVTFEGEQIDRRIQFSVPTLQTGWQDYELLVEPLPDEAGTANNVALVSWEVVRDKFRVLLADGVSQWEYRYLQQLFRRDPHIESDELLFYPRLRGTGRMATNPRLPETVDDWAVYDIVILGDLGLKQFSRASQQSLAKYVRQQSGRLILIAGRDHLPQEYQGQPLLDLLPVTAAHNATEEDGYTLMLTDEGRLHSALAIEDSNQASELAWLSIYRKKPFFWISEYCRPKPTARTLLRAVPRNRPLVIEDRSTQKNLPAFLCWHQVGNGRVVYLASPQTWVLRYRTGDRKHHRFWGQMLRWITADNLGGGTDLVRILTDKTHYTRKEPIEVTVWLKDPTGRPLAEQELKVITRTLEEEIATTQLKSDSKVAGRYFCSLEGMAAGAYEIVLSGAAVDKLRSTTEDKSPIRARISVDADDNLEMLDTTCNRALLAQIAKITGGQVIPPTALAEVLQLTSLSPKIHETVRRVPLWNRWANLWIVLGCLVAEWIVRKQKGLV